MNQYKLDLPMYTRESKEHLLYALQEYRNLLEKRIHKYNLTSIEPVQVL